MPVKGVLTPSESIKGDAASSESYSGRLKTCSCFSDPAVYMMRVFGTNGICVKEPSKQRAFSERSD